MNNTSAEGRSTASPDPEERPAPVPAGADPDRLRSAAAGCRACGLFRDATQTVFGAGASDAHVVMVGEQPGDVEDREGDPFVGPAGRLLGRAMDDVGLVRSAVYLTNAVKHFKFRRAERGKRRIHQKPDAAELAACRPWLRAELAAIRPGVVVVLGATAASTMLGRAFRVTQQRGRPQPWAELAERSPLVSAASDGEPDPIDADAVVVATVHPSSVLRARDSEERAAAYADFVADLRVVAEL
ncbi:UdgX family uracil-DNA binding protein [Phytoactinopolyspora halotolerans]|uniref:Type-4 uracil-DNA glycosylase n=1 Tax=Phytoactinopolyspora halotolerans TaxID=1981512 RepID=A0A6L9SEZ7_9ACTN|nr:UdgX family uracil-DNA binding protein [Phytoactinopolyspora halotolerans]NEE03032.1 UdgX family uracil-DNA binding protein [Phytoactinopolyspora halotolerans]